MAALISCMVCVSSITAIAESNDESFTMLASWPVGSWKRRPAYKLRNHDIAQRLATRETNRSRSLKLACIE